MEYYVLIFDFLHISNISLKKKQEPTYKHKTFEYYFILKYLGEYDQKYKKEQVTSEIITASNITCIQNFKLEIQISLSKYNFETNIIRNKVTNNIFSSSQQAINFNLNKGKYYVFFYNILVLLKHSFNIG